MSVNKNEPEKWEEITMQFLFEQGAVTPEQAREIVSHTRELREEAQNELLEALEREVKKEYTVHKDTRSTGSCHVQCHKITENMAREFFLSILNQHKK